MLPRSCLPVAQSTSSTASVTPVRRTGTFSRISRSRIQHGCPHSSLRRARASLVRGYHSASGPASVCDDTDSCEAATPPRPRFFGPRTGSAAASAAASTSCWYCRCSSAGLTQSSSGSRTNTSITPRMPSRSSASADSAWTMLCFRRPSVSSGCSSPTICGVSRNGMSSGTGNITAPVPNAMPKSMPTNPPDRLSSRKLSKWRSPMPSTYCATLKAARLRAKCARSARNASGPNAIDRITPRSKSSRTMPRHSWNTRSASSLGMTEYARR
mmetsp:Transcript_22525/g.72504  ORF Transcript_22525/g.72504 Transcript_22525/m.72504 type:complete len:270 (+) Transcript_22525:211-1020(+)